MREIREIRQLVRNTAPTTVFIFSNQSRRQCYSTLRGNTNKARRMALFWSWAKQELRVLGAAPTAACTTPLFVTPTAAPATATTTSKEQEGKNMQHREKQNNGSDALR